MYYPALHMQTVNIPIKYGFGCVFNQSVLSISVACCDEAVSRPSNVLQNKSSVHAPPVKLVGPYFLSSTSAANTDLHASNTVLYL